MYCRVPLRTAELQLGATGTWEHIINDAKIVTRENIARCCASCNASKGARPLREWLNSHYCKSKGITPDTVAEVVKLALQKSDLDPTK